MKELPPVTLEMHKPLDRSRQAEEDYDGLIRYFYGEAGQEFAQGLREGRFDSTHVPLFRDRIDPYFRRVFGRTYPHSADTTGQSSYREAQRIARETVKECVMHVYPNFSDDLFANEVTLESPSPTDFFYYLVKDDEGLVATHERRRHFLLLLGAAGIDSDSGNGELATQLMDINRLFDDELFIKGSRRQTTVFAQHNPETYEVTKVDLQRPKEVTDDTLLREYSLTLREIEGVGPVQTRIRQKNTAAAEIKMIAYAAVSSDGVLDPSVVKDYMGFTLIIFGGEKGNYQDKILLAVDKVEGLLKDKRSVNDYHYDDITGSSRGQGGVNLMRRQAFLPDFPEHPLEIQFYSAEDYLTASHEVGVKDPETGFYNGRSHRLFSLRRIAKVLPIIRPVKVYGGDPQRDIASRMQEVAEEIRGSEDEGMQLSTNGLKHRGTVANALKGMVRFFVRMH